MKSKRPKWRPMIVDGVLSATIKAEADGASGVYAIRRAKDHAVLYVGESSRGRMWRTLLRHFQAPESFRKVRERAVFAKDASGYEVALWVTSKGKRPRSSGEPADQRALDAQARWIETLKPSINVDDGKADYADELSGPWDEPQEEEHAFASLLNPSAPRVPPPNVVPERRAENRTPDLWTGRTKAEEGGKARRDWKGEAERLSRELASCRSSSSADAAPTSVHVPPSRPEGYGETDERGQARMFRANPPRALIQLGHLTCLKYRAGGRVRSLRWGLRRAPVLAYDEAGRLHVLHGAKGRGRPASPKVRAEYARTHWGEKGIGTVRGANVALPPFEELGEGVSIVYTTRKGGDGELVDYVHPWGEGGRGTFKPPHVVRHMCQTGKCAGDGLIALVGGTYRVTERGIVG